MTGAFVRLFATAALLLGRVRSTGRTRVARALLLLTLGAAGCDLAVSPDASPSTAAATPSTTSTFAPATARGGTATPPAPRPEPSTPRTSESERLDLAKVAEAEREAVRVTARLIDEGGPFPYDRDGVTFQNREGRLPRQPRGHYREYTVPTPGIGHRGARRIIAGKGGELYYTADHYESFVLLRKAGP